MNKREILLVRHGSGDHMVPGVVVGRAPDAKLTAKGSIEAMSKGLELKERGVMPDRFMSSPIARCIETGRLAMITMGIKNPLDVLEIDDDLIEMDQGRAVGLAAEVAYNPDVRRLISLYGNDYAHDDAESVNQVGERGLHFLEREALIPTGTTLAYTHGGLITATAALLEGWNRSQFDTYRETASTVSETRLVYEDNKWNLDYFARPIHKNVTSLRSSK